MTVDPSVPVSVTIVADANPVCAGNTVNFTATPVNGGSSPAYQWSVNASPVSGATNQTFSHIPANGDVITCVLTSSLEHTYNNPATSNPVVMTVNPLLSVSIGITVDNNPVCAGATVNFLAIPVNGGLTPSYQWKINGNSVSGATNSGYSYKPSDGDVVICELISSEICTSGNPATSNSLTMTVNPLNLVEITIAAVNNPVCEGSAINFTATAVNGGTSPVYQWKVNGNNYSGATNSTFSYTPVNNDIVTCSLTSNISCSGNNPAISNSVTVIVTQKSPVSVTIAPNVNPICSGSTITFTATPVNGGSNPAYQWIKNSAMVFGATNSTYSYIPANNDFVICLLTSNATCISGNPAISAPSIVSVTPLVPVSVSINAGANPVCAGTPVLFTAVPVNGGTTPAYQWKVNGSDINGATSSSFSHTPSNGDIITCMLTSNANCTSGNPATSNSIVMAVTPLSNVSVTISADANPVCQGTPAGFTAIPVNGGSSPAYQWQVNSNNISGATSSTFGYVAVNQDVVTCLLTSNLVCTSGNPATSNSVVMTVNSVSPVSVSISTANNPVCAGNQATFTATPVNGGLTPAYQWKVNLVNVTGATNATYSYAPAAGDAVSCQLTSSASCISGNPALSNTIVMTVNPAPVPVINGLTSTCQGATGLFYYTEGGMSNYTWTISAGGTITTNLGAFIFVSWQTAGAQWLKVNYTNGSGCSAVTATQYNVTVEPLPVPVITGNVTPCAGATGVVYTTEPGMQNYSWTYSSGGTNTAGGTSGSNSMTMTWNSAGPQWVRVTYASAIGCAAAAPTTLNVEVGTPVAAGVSIVASANPVEGGTTVTFTATPVNGGVSPTYQWKVNGSTITGASNSSYSYIPVNNDQVQCVMTSNHTCVTGSPANSNIITMTVNSLPNDLIVQNVTVGASQTVCYNALDTITVAGGLTTFTVEDQGSATFIAGKAIYFLPGTTVALGGTLIGKIAPEGPWCPTAKITEVIAGTGEETVATERAWFTLYPNPTSGNFTLVQKGDSHLSDVRIEIFTMTGNKMKSERIIGEQTEVQFSEMPAGLYFVKIIATNYAETIKVVKTR
jgi:hypothetical protein